MKGEAISKVTKPAIMPLIFFDKTPKKEPDKKAKIYKASSVPISKMECPEKREIADKIVMTRI